MPRFASTVTIMMFLIGTRVPDQSAVAAARPNLIVIMADDLGYGDLECYDGWIKTPQLNRMAKEGMRFLDFHSSGNVCSPTRAGLLTGRYQQRAGIPGVIFADPARPAHKHGLQSNEITFAKLLHDSGYATAMFGKWHLGYTPRYNPIRHGFDLFRGYVSGNVDFFSHVDQAGNFDWWQQDELRQEEGYTTHLITRHAIEFIEQNKSRPFCLYLPHEAPHYPYQGPNDEPQREVGRTGRTTGNREDIKVAYREMVQEMDLGIGQVLDALRTHKIDRSTLVLFFSDNGANQRGSNGELRGFKGSNWEGGHRVPALAWWPGRIAAGSVSNETAITLDVMPTLLSVAGVQTPADHSLDGIDLSGIMFDGESLPDRSLVWNGAAIRSGPWKLIRETKGNRKDTGFQLFRLDEDPGEKNDLAQKFPERVKTMKQSLERWKSDMAATATAQPGQ